MTKWALYKTDVLDALVAEILHKCGRGRAGFAPPDRQRRGLRRAWSPLQSSTLPISSIPAGVCRLLLGTPDARGDGVCCDELPGPLDFVN